LVVIQEHKSVWNYYFMLLKFIFECKNKFVYLKIIEVLGLYKNNY
jgi:hypothetical protein